MKLMFPVIIILLGLLAGAVVCTLFKETATGRMLSVLAGGLGAFAGLIVRDVLDFAYINPLLDTFLAAIVGAVIFATITNLVFGQTGR